MSKVFICAAIPDELATREEGAVAVATAIEAGDERRARAKFHWQFLEHYPAAQDCAYKFIVCEDKPGIPRPALDSWDAEYMQENRWDEESASFVPVETESDPMNVTFDKLAPEVQNAVMVKFDTCENITVDMVISAQELLQEDMATFDGHIVEALMKMPEVNAMYPELKLHAIGWVKHKCIPGAKWPEIQAEMRIWKNVAKVNARKPENTRLLLISPAPEPEPINSTLKIQQENQPGHCCHSSRIQADMENTG